MYWRAVETMYKVCLASFDELDPRNESYSSDDFKHDSDWLIKSEGDRFRMSFDQSLQPHVFGMSMAASGHWGRGRGGIGACVDPGSSPI